MTRHLLSIDDLSTPELLALTTPAPTAMPLDVPLRGTLAFLFQQASLRTMASFARAGVPLGLAPITLTTNGGAFRDQCDFNDEVYQLGLISTCVVARSSLPLDKTQVRRCTVPVVNAGDGTNEHPTQALLDLALIRRIGVAGKSVVLMGNLHHRVHHSLGMALQRLEIPVSLICPPGLGMDPSYFRGPVSCVQLDNARDVDDALAGADFIYLTMVTHWDTLDAPYRESFTLDLARAHRVLKPTAKILHPFPRMGELVLDLDPSPFNAYYEQTRLGPEIRYRVLRWLIDDVLPTDTADMP